VVINRVRQELNYGLHVAGLIVTQSDSRIGTHKRWEEQVRSLVGANLPIFENVIPNNIDLAKAAAAGRSALAFAPRSNGAQAYRALAEEIKHGEKA
jgi:chromosome partitioning protein